MLHSLWVAGFGASGPQKLKALLQQISRTGIWFGCQISALLTATMHCAFINIVWCWVMLFFQLCYLSFRTTLVIANVSFSVCCLMLLVKYLAACNGSAFSVSWLLYLMLALTSEESSRKKIVDRRWTACELSGQVFGTACELALASKSIAF